MIQIIVPATSANIGPGFDSLGIALNIYNKFNVEEIEEGLIINGCDEEYKNENNLIYTSMLKCFKKLGYKHKGMRITIDSEIPVSRGLGSSAACILAGVVSANELAKGGLSRDEILKIATEIEGHPDNIAPALFGGMVASIVDNDNVYCSKIPVTDGIKFYALIPNFELSTKKARSVLPKVIPFDDGVFNVGRTALMIAALVNGEFDLLKVASKDKLHQKYRGILIDEYDTIIEKCEHLGFYGTFLSGAGPTIIAVDKEKNKSMYNDLLIFLSELENKWEIKEMSIDYHGIVIN